MARNNISRRTITKRSAWTLPVLTSAAAVPTQAASTTYQIGAPDVTNYSYNNNWTNTVTLQSSTDGGTTWTAVSAASVSITIGTTTTVDDGGQGPVVAFSLTTSSPQVTDTNGEISLGGVSDVPGGSYKAYATVTVTYGTTVASFVVTVDTT